MIKVCQQKRDNKDLLEYMAIESRRFQKIKAVMHEVGCHLQLTEEKRDHTFIKAGKRSLCVKYETRLV